MPVPLCYRGQTSNIVDVDGRKIHCEETGSGKHHVLLMPGALGTPFICCTGSPVNKRCSNHYICD